MAAIDILTAQKSELFLKNLNIVFLNEAIREIPFLSSKTGIDSLPYFAYEYLNASGENAVQNYDYSRYISELSEGRSFEKFAARHEKISRAANDEIFGGLGEIGKKFQDFESETSLLSAISTVTEKSFFQEWRSTFVDNSTFDPEADAVNILTSVGACDFCFLMKNSQYYTNVSNSFQNKKTGLADFHDNCRCTYGVIFKQQDYRKFETQADKAFISRLENAGWKQGNSMPEPSEILKIIREEEAI